MIIRASPRADSVYIEAYRGVKVTISPYLLVFYTQF